MKTVLYERHLKLGAKIVDFAGWEMPLQYEGILKEHRAVREHAGIFDVSHMGRIDVIGEKAEDFLDYLSTNKIKGKPDLSAIYTVWCNEEGGAVDDLMIYKRDSRHFFVVVNASNRDKDLNHLLKYQKDFDVSINPRYEGDGILAVQGPDAKKITVQFFPEAATLKPMRFLPATFQGGEVIVSETGYTGAGGVEIYAPNDLIPTLWDMFLSEGVQPVGLGARDTLRLEKGYALYGHELSDSISPTESVSAWTVKLQKEFVGKAKLKANRRSYGIVLEEKGIAREGYRVFCKGECIGKVTSGTFSPTLNQAIALILVDRSLKEGDRVDVEVRKKQCQAKIVPLPFY